MAFTNAMPQPPPEHVRQILGAAETTEKVAKRFVNGLGGPTDFLHWFLDPEKARAFLAEVS